MAKKIDAHALIRLHQYMCGRRRTPVPRYRFMGVNAATGSMVPPVGSDMPAQLAEGGRSHGSSEEEDRDEEEGSGEEAGEEENREEEEVTLVTIDEV